MTYSNQLAQVLLDGGVAVIRTDTIYGLVASAHDEKAVMRVYDIKGRDGRKPPIVLVADEDQMFDQPSALARRILSGVWPGKVSVIMPSNSAPSWINRGGQTVAYRLPNNRAFQDLLRETGPLIAPSANPQGKEPATTISQAKQYFGTSVDWYEDGGEIIDAVPSALLRILPDGTTERLR